MRAGKPVKVGRAGLAAVFASDDDAEELGVYKKQLIKLEFAEKVAEAAAQGSRIPAIASEET